MLTLTRSAKTASMSSARSIKLLYFVKSLFLMQYMSRDFLFDKELICDRVNVSFPGLVEGVL